MDFFKYPIKEDNWNFYIIEDDDEMVQDKDDAAVVEHDKKECYFRRSEITEVNVKHELWHIYVGYCYLYTADLDSDAFEEITAELFAYEAEHILKKSKEIYKKLAALRDETNKSRYKDGK